MRFNIYASIRIRSIKYNTVSYIEVIQLVFKSSRDFDKKSFFFLNAMCAYIFIFDKWILIFYSTLIIIMGGAYK